MSKTFCHCLLVVVLQFLVEVKYPRLWNCPQDWRCDLTACKASGTLVFYHKMFFMGTSEAS